MRHGIIKRKYSLRIPNPPKEVLLKLYNDDFKTQQEIGVIYNVSQKVVCRWFSDLEIKSRIPYKRNQSGENNNSWKGDNASYAACHYRVQSVRGKANCCEVCNGQSNSTFFEWANLSGNFTDVNDYKMMCRSCHKKHDRIGRNFREKIPNTRKIFDGIQ